MVAHQSSWQQALHSLLRSPSWIVLRQGNGLLLENVRSSKCGWRRTQTCCRLQLRGFLLVVDPTYERKAVVRLLPWTICLVVLNPKEKERVHCARRQVSITTHYGIILRRDNTPFLLVTKTNSFFWAVTKASLEKVASPLWPSSGRRWIKTHQVNEVSVGVQVTFLFFIRNCFCKNILKFRT